MLGKPDDEHVNGMTEVSNIGFQSTERENMRIGIATDHGGFNLKEELIKQLREAGHEVIDLTPTD